MGTKDIIGHIDCPVCGHEMPVKEDKNRHSYGHCAHRCNAQVFTRNDHRDSLLRMRMRAVSGTVTAPEPKKGEPLAIPTFVPTVPAPAPKPDPAPPAPPRLATPNAEPRPKGNWLNPLLGGAKHGRA